MTYRTYFKKDGAQRLPQIFNINSSIFNHFTHQAATTPDINPKKCPLQLMPGT